MMTSPEEYYEYHLKGKSAEQIMTQIRGLKREINRLIRILEHPDYEQTIDPGEDVQLYCTWEYLERAKSALEEAGGTYVPTKAEQKELVFLENMPYICSIIFSIGGFFSGYETRIFTIDEQVNLRVENLFAAESNESERKLELTKEELMKYEIAQELGLLDKVMTEGWRALSSKETGRIGGLLAKKKRTK